MRLATVLNDGAYQPWIEIARFGSHDEAESRALVLIARGIGSRLVADPGGVSMLVAAPDAARARFEFAAYDRENRETLTPRTQPAPWGQGIDGALAYVAVLVFFHAAAGRHAFSLDWLQAGAAQAGLISGGEWWRAVTALGLHADFEHLAANLAAGGVFGILLSRVLGSGLAWLAILASGAIGNAVVALLYPDAHTAIGASTAVFGAVGLLAALALKRQTLLWRRGFRRWAPLAAGLMLLALLGMAGERTDVGAHFAGFCVGALLGAVIHVAIPRPPQSRSVQLALGALALALFAACWLFAFSAAATVP
jgi:membrane associated rhomboid family serine protease